MGLEAMYSAISGLQGDSTWLDVIGNNISNVSTTAYKASRLEFSNQISNNLATGEGDDPAEGLGGTNPEQVGLGVKVASIDTLFTEGQIQQTGITTDIAIVGNGFLTVKSDNQSYLTRAGNLDFDSNGNLVDQNGGLVQGYTAAIQYTQTTVNNAGPQLIVDSANLVLNDNDPANISNIQIKPNMVVPAKQTTQVNIAGNLDSFQQADQPGGILNLIQAGGNPLLPVADGAAGATTSAALQLNAAGEYVQAANLALPAAAPASQLVAAPVVTAGMSLAAARAGANWAWMQQPPITPATETVSTVYDSLGNAHQITTLYYQVNDLGEAGVNHPTAAGQSQAVYAWYSFDTTGGVAPFSGSTVGGGNGQDSNLIGGTGITEDYTRNTGDTYAGDFIYFNTDGSLASMGGVDVTTGTQVQADLYLPPADQTVLANPLAPVAGVPPFSPMPTIGANITQFTMNFGSAGTLGNGLRNGLISDAEGSYQTINGVNTYVPLDTATTASQNGYADGTLQSLSFNAAGVIEGVFSNGQTLAVGQVVLTSVTNPEGLNSVGNGYYTPSSNAGPTYTGIAGTNGLGTIDGSSLEGSNVDLTVELSNMIIAQRGYEANARVISVVNSTLQTLTSLGQGG